MEDPGTWERPWTGEFTWPATDQPIYEYACHEANYALENILRGARQRDAEAANGRARFSIRRDHADEIHALRLGAAFATGCCSGHGASCIRRRVRRQSSGAAQGPNRQSRMGEPAHLDPHGGEEAGRRHRSVDDRRRQPELAAPSGDHQELSADRHRDRRRRLPGARPLAQAGKRPQHHLS